MKKKTRVMLLINHLSDGGAQRVVSLWAHFLRQKNYAVTVLTFYPREDEYDLDTHVTRANLYTSFNAYCQIPNQITTSTLLLDQYLTQHPQDIIIPFSYKPNIICAKSSKQKHTLITQTLRNSPWSIEPNFDRNLRDECIKKQGSVILQNTEQAKYFTTPEFAHVKKYIIHNPLNPAITKIKKKKYSTIKKIIAIGRLVPQKNQMMMIEAVQVLRDQYNFKCQLDIYGVGPEQKKLQQAINQYKLQDQIFLRGRNNNIFQTAIKYDLFIMTSFHEGTPNALLESMGLGLPVISTNCQTGPKELINNTINGYILDSYEPAALAKQIIQINHVDILKRIGRQARHDMKRYRQKICTNELITCLNTLLKDYHPYD